jgi:hypothetical protein
MPPIQRGEIANAARGLLRWQLVEVCHGSLKSLRNLASFCQTGLRQEGQFRFFRRKNAELRMIGLANLSFVAAFAAAPRGPHRSRR